MGWEFEEMERNVELVENSNALRAGARDLVNRAADMSKGLLEREIARASIERGGARPPPERTASARPVFVRPRACSHLCRVVRIIRLHGLSTRGNVGHPPL